MSFTGLSTGVTPIQESAGKHDKYIMVYGDFGVDGQLQLQIEAADKSGFIAFPELTFAGPSIKKVDFLHGRRWRVEAVDCVSVTVELG